MNSKIIYVVTSSTSGVLSTHTVCSSMNAKNDALSAVSSSCVSEFTFSPSESQVPSSTYDHNSLVNSTFHGVPAEDSIDVHESKLEQKFFPEVSAAQTSIMTMCSHDAIKSDYETLDSKEQSQPNIVLENVDHSAPEIFSINDCGSELYLTGGVKVTDGKEHRIHNYENDGSSAYPIVELSIVPDDGLWTCLYCGLSIQSSQDQIRTHLDWYCNSKRKSFHGSNQDVSRPISPDIDVKTAVDPSQISAISFVSNCNNYDKSSGIQGSGTSGLNVSINDLPSFYKCPVCTEEVVALGDHLLEHEKEDLVNVILKSALPYVNSAPLEDDITIVEESRDGASVVPSSVDVEILQSTDQTATDGHSHHHQTSILQNKKRAFSPHPEVKSKCRSLLTQVKSSPKKYQTQKVNRSGNIVLSRSIQSNILNKHVSNSKRSFRQWSSRAPHPCPVCGKVLSSRGNLSKHLLQHSSAKPWNCSACNLGFNSHRDWDYHQLQYHSMNRPHVCPVCSKSFAVLANLKEHVVFHGQKTKACDVCGKMFWTSKCVSRHKKRHYTDKKYSCSLCSKEFAIKWDYSLHYKKVHGTK